MSDNGNGNGVRLTKERVSLGLEAMALLWSLLIAVGTAIWLLASLTVKVDLLSSRLEQHIVLPGHPGEIERLNAIDKRVDGLEDRITTDESREFTRKPS